MPTTCLKWPTNLWYKANLFVRVIAGRGSSHGGTGGRVIARGTPLDGKFQTSLELPGVMNVEQFANWLADRSAYKPVLFKQMIMEIEEGILSAAWRCEVRVR